MLQTVYCPDKKGLTGFYQIKLNATANSGGTLTKKES